MPCYICQHDELDGHDQQCRVVRALLAGIIAAGYIGRGSPGSSSEIHEIAIEDADALLTTLSEQSDFQ